MNEMITTGAASLLPHVLDVLRRLQPTHRSTNHLQVTQVVVNGLPTTFADQQ